MKRLIEGLAKQAGLVLLPDWRAIRIDEERHLTRLFKFLDVDCVFDVGANVGQYAHMLRSYCSYRGRIISFEPHPAALSKIVPKATRDDLWTIETYALGSSDGEAIFHAYGLSELGSFRSFSDSPHAPTNVSNETVTVQVRRLKDVLPELQRKFPFKRAFLKLDTQGFDLEVAKGAADALRQFVGIQSEIAFQNIYADAPTYREAIDFYQSSGFSLSRLVPIHDIHFPELVEMDAIFVRSDLASQSAPSSESNQSRP
jgi:FkbM family methyltransferase